MELILGAALLIAWAVLFLWSAARVAISAWRGSDLDSGRASGFIAGTVLAAGIILFFKNSLPFDMIGVGFVLAAVGSISVWAMGRATGALAAPPEKLQAEALDILTDMIRRNLLTASVSISDPACSLACNVLDAYPTGSRDATREEILNSYMTGVLPKRKGAPGITLTINQEFRLPPKGEAEVRAQLASRSLSKLPQ